MLLLEIPWDKWTCYGPCDVGNLYHTANSEEYAGFGPGALFVQKVGWRVNSKGQGKLLILVTVDVSGTADRVYGVYPDQNGQLWFGYITPYDRVPFNLPEPMDVRLVTSDNLAEALFQF